MDKELKITQCEMSELNNDSFKAPAKFYFISALGYAVFIHTKDRTQAEQWITENYGKGFYKLRTSSSEKPKGDLTCTGSNTRKCFAPRLKGIRG